MRAASSGVADTALLLIIAGCSASREAPEFDEGFSAPRAATSTTQPAQRLSDHLDVLEAVYRYQFDDNPSVGQRDVDYFVLALEADADPPNALLSRFVGERPKVITPSDWQGLPSDVREHAGRVFFELQSIAWLNGDTAMVQGGHREGLLPASTFDYLVKRAGRRWKVVGQNWRGSA